MRIGIVLWRHIEGCKLPSELSARVDVARDLYRAWLIEKILVSGKYSYLYSHSNHTIVEAEEMKKQLIAEHIPENDIWVESWSTNTVENLWYSRALFMSKDISVETVYLISSDYHLCRIVSIAERLFAHEYNLLYVGVKTMRWVGYRTVQWMLSFVDRMLLFFMQRKLTTCSKSALFMG